MNKSIFFVAVFSPLDYNKYTTYRYIFEAKENDNLLELSWKGADKTKYELAILMIAPECEACCYGECSQWKHCLPGGCMNKDEK